jgi:hypothetical protein
MKKVIFTFAAMLAFTCAYSQQTVKVKSYVKDDGTYVPEHQRTAPNNTNVDNWSTKPNVNPTTGKEGTKTPNYNTTTTTYPTYTAPKSTYTPTKVKY